MLFSKPAAGLYALNALIIAIDIGFEKAKLSKMGVWC
jgi:hypothetical protein